MMSGMSDPINYNWKDPLEASETMNQDKMCGGCNDDTGCNVLIYKHCLWSFDNRFEVNWPPEATLVLRWISKFFLFGALPSDTLKIKHTKKLKEIPSRHFLENLPEKASMYAFIHLKLIGNLQGFCQYIMADMLNFTIANYRKYSGLAFLGP